MWLASIIALQAAASLGANVGNVPEEDRPSWRISLTGRTTCAASPDAGEVTVCGGRPDRYRLPLPVARTDNGDRRAGDVPGGAAALTSRAPCGIFAGQRRCGKAEAARYGYGGGRDPLTVLVKLTRKIVDPDAN